MMICAALLDSRMKIEIEATAMKPQRINHGQTSSR
jgi:hypothetical protein